LSKIPKTKYYFPEAVFRDPRVTNINIPEFKKEKLKFLVDAVAMSFHTNQFEQVIKLATLHQKEYEQLLNNHE
jgi:hypothetical protein